MKRALAAVTVAGGLAVLGSYIWGAAAHPGAAAAMWGGVPAAVRPLYTVNMLLAALGFFLFASFIFMRTGGATRIAGRWGPRLFVALFAAITLPSALWMPLTLAMAAQPGAALWAAICAVLALVGLASLGVLAALLALRPRRPAWHWALAVAGAVPFCLQTAVLDALVWTALYPR